MPGIDHEAGTLPTRRSRGWALATAVVALLGLLLAVVDAEARGKKRQSRNKVEQEETELLRLVWPEPPLEPRIRFLQTYANEKHLGRKPTRRELFMEFFAGAVPPSTHVYQPMDIAVSDDGQRFYVSDFGRTVVFLFDYATKRVTQIGERRPFSRPFGVALDGEENLYVSEQANRRVVVLDREHQPIRIIQHPSLVRPGDVDIDRARGLLYVADPSTKASDDHSVKVFDLEGNLLRTVGSKGICEGCLFFPTYVAVDAGGNLYVTSTLKSQVDVFDKDGNYLKQFGERGTSFGMFDKPKGVAVDSFGNVYVVDSGWSNVQIFNQKGQVLLFFGGRGAHPGLLKNPTGIAIDAQNRIYVADYLNYRVSAYELVNTSAEDSYIEPGQQPLLAPADGVAAASGDGQEIQAQRAEEDRR
jgi:DNA-binding beta-propeller fold protein YncE